jgi:hypothetical protein
MIYFAGNTGTRVREKILIKRKCARLFSYHFIETGAFQTDKMYEMSKEYKSDIFLDSGAFSAFTKGKKINIKNYISFIKKNKKHLTAYANLDVIGINGERPNEHTAKKTLSNQKKMEGNGLKPIPCFHYGEPFKYLEYYIKNYDYIALGAMVGIAVNKLIPWLDKCFNRYICDEKGMPNIKIHGFGVTSISIILRYPFYSIDSTSWVISGLLGSIYVPRIKNNHWDYSQKPFKINVSNRNNGADNLNNQYDHLPYLAQKAVRKYLGDAKIKMGNSTFHQVDKNYKIQEGERWLGKPYEKKRDIERIIEKGVCNDYKMRDRINIKYFLDLEKSIPQWPWPFKINVNNGFGL